MINLPYPFKRPLSRKLVRAAGDPERRELITLGELIAMLGDRSFGWCMVIFALINMLPLPIGANMVTSLPLILLTGQMVLGLQQVWLPEFLTRGRISRKKFQKRVLWLRPVIRPIERVVRPRLSFVFSQRHERLLGFCLFAISVALFLPIPIYSIVTATALLVAGVGIVERDGLLTLCGVALGALAIAAAVTLGLLILPDAPG